MTTIVVGGGITGLYLARELAKKGTKVLLIEKDRHVGGRIHTINGLEAGAGRIHESHKLTLGLIKEYGLDTIQIGKESYWRSIGSSVSMQNRFEAMWAAFLEQIRHLSPVVLSVMTLQQVAREILGPDSAKALLDLFPYRTELESMKADVAILGFDRVAKGGYCVVAGGLSLLVEALVDTLKKLGVEIRTDLAVTDVTLESDGTYLVHSKGQVDTLSAPRVILTIPVTELRRLPVMRGFKTLEHLDMAPLIRIYAKFPTPWFSDSERLVTDSPLRYLIPIRAEEGIIMISYTDGRDTKRWAGLSGPALAQIIHQEVKRLFPERNVSAPTWVKSYDWKDGTTYWKPGSYDAAAESEAAIRPRPSTMPELYVCGESFSLLQAWIEGSLEHAERLLKI